MGSGTPTTKFVEWPANITYDPITYGEAGEQRVSERTGGGEDAGARGGLVERRGVEARVGLEVHPRQHVHYGQHGEHLARPRVLELRGRVAPAHALHEEAVHDHAVRRPLDLLVPLELLAELELGQRAVDELLVAVLLEHVELERQVVDRLVVLAREVLQRARQEACVAVAVACRTAR